MGETRLIDISMAYDTTSPRQFTLRHLFFALALMAVAMAFVLSFGGLVNTAREAAVHSSCKGRMKQLIIGLFNYEAQRGSLPPAVTTDASGTPLHSWRTMLLPYIEERTAYQNYRWSEPWNGPQNSMATYIKIDPFRCLSEKSIPHHTDYVAILGRDTVWGVNQGIKLSEIADNLSETIVLVEMKHSGIGWAEPRDLDWDNLPPTFDKKDYIRLLSNHPAGLNVAMADGSVKCLPPDFPLEVFEAMLTKSGGEKIDLEKWREINP